MQGYQCCSRRTRGCARCSRSRQRFHGARDRRRGALQRTRSVRAKAFRRQGRINGVQSAGGDRRGRRRRPGDARVSLHGRGDAADRQGSRRAGAASSAAACVRCCTAPAPDACSKCASCRRTPTSRGRSAGDLRPRRHLSGGPCGGPGRVRRARNRADLRARDLRAARGCRRSAHVLVLGGRGAAAAARRRPPIPMPPRKGRNAVATKPRQPMPQLIVRSPPPDPRKSSCRSSRGSSC